MEQDEDQIQLLNTTDASVWAEEFMQIFGSKRELIDIDLMIAWFANAIMTANDKAVMKNNSKLEAENLKLRVDVSLLERDVLQFGDAVKFLFDSYNTYITRIQAVRESLRSKT